MELLISSYIGTDSDWDYNGEDYYWTNQFDYVMIANINDRIRVIHRLIWQ